MREEKELERRRIMMRERRGREKSREKGERERWDGREGIGVKVEVREERAEEVKRGRKWEGIGRIVVNGKERGRRKGKKERGEKDWEWKKGEIERKEGGERERVSFFPTIICDSIPT